MTTLGVVFLPQLPPAMLRDIARAADDAGVDELWLWEDCFRETCVAAAAVALASTEKLRIGMGLLPVPLRNVALTAMEIATMEGIFPGRARVGIGHGVQEWMAQVGARVESPLTLLREHAVALRSLLKAERVTAKGRYVTLGDVALDWPPPKPPNILVGAEGPRTLALSGEIADGTILTAGTTPDAVTRARDIIDRARQHSNVETPHETVVYVHAATGPSAPRRLEAERNRWGYESMVDRAISGGADEFAAGIGRWAEAGAGTVVLQPTPDDPDPEGFANFIGHEVRPLVE